MINYEEQELIALISQINTFDEFEQLYFDIFDQEEDIAIYLKQLVYKYGKKVSVVSFDAHYSPSYLGNIINKKKNNPSRDALIAICLAMNTSIDEVQSLLKYSGYSPLLIRKKRDLIIWFGFVKKEKIETVNYNLIQRELKPLYKED